MMLVVDNFDSFTYNLVQYFGRLGVEQRVIRNNEMTPQEALALEPEQVVLSPGPCSPDEAGHCLEFIATFAGRVPLFGVCLGHQCIGQHFGGKVVQADRLMHGKTSLVHHQENQLFSCMSNPFRATRYHSLIVERKSLPDCLQVTAETDTGEIMGLKHRSWPVWGVQFHPESLATDSGIQVLENFLKIAN